MNKVIQFLLSKLNFITFIVLEVICLALIFSNNPYQGAAFYNSSNNMVGEILKTSNNAKEYIRLKDVNLELAKENAQLRQALTERALQNDISYTGKKDSTYVKKYQYTTAKVINNSTKNFRNYLTINKGWADSISPGMGVVCNKGIVGRVKSCSKNFSTITSVLHKEIMVSSKLKRANATCTMRWYGIDATKAKLLYVPRHLSVRKGDTIVTSEYNSVFPEGEMVGFVDEVKIKGDENFYNIDINLSTDFTKLSYVYVIKNKLRFQLDSLEEVSTADRNESK